MFNWREEKDLIPTFSYISNVSKYQIRLQTSLLIIYSSEANSNEDKVHKVSVENDWRRKTSNWLICACLLLRQFTMIIIEISENKSFHFNETQCNFKFVIYRREGEISSSSSSFLLRIIKWVSAGKSEPFRAYTLTFIFFSHQISSGFLFSLI